MFRYFLELWQTQLSYFAFCWPLVGRKSLDNNDRDQVLWARETEHPNSPPPPPPKPLWYISFLNQKKVLNSLALTDCVNAFVLFCFVLFCFQASKNCQVEKKCWWVFYQMFFLFFFLCNLVVSLTWIQLCSLGWKMFS